MVHREATFGERIEVARIRKEMDRYDLAIAVGVTFSVVYKWELDRTPPKANFIRGICIALGVEPNYLLGFEEWADEIQPPVVVAQVVDTPVEVAPVHRPGANQLSLSTKF